MQPVKFCPKCKTPNALTVPSCPQCGHMFRTQFVTPDQTQMGMPSPVQPVQQERGVPWFVWMFGGCCALPVLLIVIIGALGRSMPHTHKEAGPHAATLCKEMQSLSLPPVAIFLQQFGQPSKTTKMQVSGVSYSVWFYDTNDGEVQVWVNVPLQIVERVGTSD